MTGADTTAEELVARAHAMVSVLRSRREECDELGRIPDATITELVAAGFYRVLQPRRFGGLELDLATFSRVSIEIARGCPSTGWVYAFTAGHTHLLSALFSERCQVEVYGGDGEVRMPGSLRAQPAEVVAGGYRLSGAWDYVSGCDSATHFVLGAECEPARGGEAVALTCILDAAACTIVDNWDMHGLRGTGSKRVVADAVFVPEHRTIASLSGIDARVGARTRDRPGRSVHSNPIYRSGGIFSVLFGEAVAVAIGIARATLDVYEETVRSRATMTPPIVPMKDHPQIQRCFGEAVQQIDVAEHGLLGSDRDYMDWCERDAAGVAPFSAEREQRLIVRKLLCARLCASAVDLMVRTGGTTGIRRGAPIERLQRDMITLMTHPTVQLETSAETYAALRFGTPSPDGVTAG